MARRRKKSAKSVDGDDSGNSNIRQNLVEGISLLRYRAVNGSLEYIFEEACKPRDGRVKPSRISSELELK